MESVRSVAGATFVTEIARFKIISGIGLYGSIGAPILIYAASDLMQFYIYRQFLSTISVSLDESALLDGSATSSCAVAA